MRLVWLAHHRSFRLTAANSGGQALLGGERTLATALGSRTSGRPARSCITVFACCPGAIKQLASSEPAVGTRMPVSSQRSSRGAHWAAAAWSWSLSLADAQRKRGRVAPPRRRPLPRFVARWLGTPASGERLGKRDMCRFGLPKQGPHRDSGDVASRRRPVHTRHTQSRRAPSSGVPSPSIPRQRERTSALPADRRDRDRRG